MDTFWDWMDHKPKGCCLKCCSSSSFEEIEVRTCMNRLCWFQSLPPHFFFCPHRVCSWFLCFTLKYRNASCQHFTVSTLHSSDMNNSLPAALSVHARRIIYVFYNCMSMKELTQTGKQIRGNKMGRKLFSCLKCERGLNSGKQKGSAWVAGWAIDTHSNAWLIWKV